MRILESSSIEYKESETILQSVQRLAKIDLELNNLDILRIIELVATKVLLFDFFEFLGPGFVEGHNLSDHGVFKLLGLRSDKLFKGCVWAQWSLNNCRRTERNLNQNLCDESSLVIDLPQFPQS